MIDAFGKERCEMIGQHVVETGATVRAAAQYFGVSKSTVHKDLTYKLKYINPSLYNSVKEILQRGSKQLSTFYRYFLHQPISTSEH